MSTSLLFSTMTSSSSPSTSLLAHLLSPIFTNTSCITNKYELLSSFSLGNQVFPKLYLASAAYAQSTSSKLKGCLVNLNNRFKLPLCLYS